MITFADNVSTIFLHKGARWRVDTPQPMENNNRKFTTAEIYRLHRVFLRSSELILQTFSVLHLKTVSLKQVCPCRSLRAARTASQTANSLQG